MIFLILLYSIAILFLVVYVLIDISGFITLTEAGRLFLLIGSCFFLYFGGLLLSKVKNDNKPMKINLWIYFILYLLLLITLTLFDTEWGRQGISLKIDFSCKDCYERAINLVPFKTIMMYVKGFNSLYSTKQILLNLFGNVIALMPMAFFLPLLFPKQNKFRNFILTTTAIIFFIEFLQLISFSGNFDIDDFILNLLGAITMYGILKIKSVNHFIRNIFLLEKNKITKQSYIKIFGSLFVVLLGCIVLVSFRKNLYNHNLDEHYKKYNPKIEIVDETKTCAEVLEQFYEDDFRIYYFPCMKSDFVYAIINDEEKYLVKDILNTEDFEYNIDIYRIRERLDYYHVSYIEKEKYLKIPFSVDMDRDSNYFASPTYNAFVENEEILEVKFDDRRSNLDSETYQFNVNLYFIPKKSGSSNLEVIFKNDDTGKLVKYFYRVFVDEDFNVTYSLVEDK